MPVYKWMRVSTLLHYHPEAEDMLQGLGIDAESVGNVYLEDLCEENDLAYSEFRKRVLAIAGTTPVAEATAAPASRWPVRKNNGDTW